MHHETGFPLRTLNCHQGRPHPRRSARGHLGCPSQVAEPGRSRTARNARKRITTGGRRCQRPGGEHTFVLEQRCDGTHKSSHRKCREPAAVHIFPAKRCTDPAAPCSAAAAGGSASAAERKDSATLHIFPEKTCTSAPFIHTAAAAVCIRSTSSRAAAGSAGTAGPSRPDRSARRHSGARPRGADARRWRRGPAIR